MFILIMNENAMQIFVSITLIFIDMLLWFILLRKRVIFIYIYVNVFVLQGSSSSTGGSFNLPQVTTFPAQSPNSVTILGPISSATSLTPGSTTYTSATHIQIQPAPAQQATLVTRAEKSIANTIVKPSPTKAGKSLECVGKSQPLNLNVVVQQNLNILIKHLLVNFLLECQ